MSPIRAKKSITPKKKRPFTSERPSRLLHNVQLTRSRPSRKPEGWLVRSAGRVTDLPLLYPVPEGMAMVKMGIAVFGFRGDHLEAEHTEGGTYGSHREALQQALVVAQDRVLQLRKRRGLSASPVTVLFQLQDVESPEDILEIVPESPR